MKSTLPIPLDKDVFRSVHEEVLNDLNARLYDGFRGPVGETLPRPGLKLFNDLSLYSSVHDTIDTGVDGLFYFKEKGLLVAICDERVYCRKYYRGDVVVPVNGEDGSGVFSPSGTWPKRSVAIYFANDGNYLYLSDGAHIFRLNIEGDASLGVTIDGDPPAALQTMSELDSDAPTGITQIAYIDGYLIGIDGSNRWYFSDVNNPSSWNALDFASAAGSPDLIQALRVYNREIFLFGTETFERWQNDGENPFSRIEGGFLQIGCIAPDSPVVTKEGIYWLNHERQFVRWNGSVIEELSSPYDAEVDTFSRVDDCRGYTLKISGMRFIVWNFPAQDRTLVYNLTGKDWSEWGAYDSGDDRYRMFRGACYAYADDWGEHFVGSKDTMEVFKLRQSYRDDAGSVIRTARRTGHLNYGAPNKKRSNRIFVRAVRGKTDPASDPSKIILRIRNDNGPWQEYELDLGYYGDPDPYIEERRTGIFRTRQYELLFTSPVPVAIGEAFEELEVLPR